MSSRIEQRRLEAAMKASLDGEEKGSKKARSAEASSSQPAKKSKAATPRETKGGKRIPTSGKKRRKVDSSDSSESEEEDDKSSSSSDDEPASKAVPVKKRTKVAAAAQQADSDSSEFEDEFDEDHYKGEEDRNWMQTLNELEREAILAERRDKRELAKEAWMLQHKKKKEKVTEQPSSSSKAKEKETDNSLSSLSRSKRQTTKPDEKKQAAKAALEDMQARKQAATKTARLKALAEEADSDDDYKPSKDDDDDMPTPRGDDRDDVRERPEKSSFAKPRHRQVEEHFMEQYPRVSVEAMEEVRVGRDKLVEYSREPFFSDFVQGLFARVNIGVSSSGDARYLLCQIMGVKDKSSEYEVEVAGRGSVKVKKALFVIHAGQKKSVQISQVSNKPFSSKEVDRWAYDMHKQGERMPSDDQLAECKDQLRKNWKESFKYDAETVDAMVEENLKSRKKAGNVVLNKIQLQEERDMAWEEYKNLENEEEKNAAYERWEQLREQVLQVEEVEKAQQDQAIAQERGVANINNRNSKANRTVTRKWHLEDNDTCTREYKRTGYYVFGVGDETKEITREKDFGKELKMREEAALKAAMTIDVKVKGPGDEEMVLSPTGQLLSPKAGTPTAASGAMARAHQTELAVEVDTQVASQPKKSDETVLLAPRPVNPLKPVAAAKAASGAGKVTLSLDDYKRRRGL